MRLKEIMFDETSGQLMCLEIDTKSKQIISSQPMSKRSGVKEELQKHEIKPPQKDPHP